MQNKPGWPGHDQNQDDIAIFRQHFISAPDLGRLYPTHPFNSIALFFCDRDSLGAGGQGNVVVGAFAQKREELVGVGGNQLCKLRVAGAKLLQNRLEHLWLLLNNLAELLELRVMSEKIQVAQICTTLRCTRSSSSRATTATSSATTPTSLSGKIEEVYASIILSALLSSGGGRGGLRRSGCGSLASMLFLLNVLRNTL